MQTKVDIRQAARSYWKEFMTGAGEEELQNAFQHFLATESTGKKGRLCLAYYPIHSEFNVLTALRNSGWKVALPLVGEGFSLSFHLYLKEGKEQLPLRPGAYGIMEPEKNAPVIHPEPQDILIVPTMAANAEGYRLGKGGGFYDRLMDRKPFDVLEKWAVLPEKLLDSPFPAEPHDLRLNKIITEERIVTYP
ncbi:MAG TPA: 5-formyltetrahydrofolate cyclo-ligase [Leptospiraceae bacterium]|nr:5-formyltetrahydrofolate cyclo-ligase [Spirochaetaceae bacterium]HBS05871.1 5-formyltetrahydrofolate cyclo-ligase [Leptospiraceae bacterium]|tara:strand:+ start:2449 stop:3024 length:576 start_codon:yes stop_codon:yes gene_type:complete